MNKIVPFKKEILFKTNLSEITSISLEHEILSKEDNLIKGNFFISGEYKEEVESIETREFSYKVPFTVDLSKKYLIDNILVDIDDFYYEITDNNVLKVCIDINIDNLEEEIEEKTWEEEELPISRCIEEENTNIFDKIDERETYKSYIIYILREQDTIDTIISKYNVTKESLEDYNDLENLKVGDKVIIPSI